MADAGDPAAPPRRPWVARILAPLALVAALVAVVMIVSGSLAIDDEPEGRSADNGSKQERSGDPDAEKEEESPEETDEDSPETYEVQSGDSLSSIAAEFGLSVEKLQRLNPDADPTALATGQILKLQ